MLLLIQANNIPRQLALSLYICVQLCVPPGGVSSFMKSHVGQVLCETPTQDMFIHVHENKEAISLSLPYL